MYEVSVSVGIEALVFALLFNLGLLLFSLAASYVQPLNK
jgi:hypothetical protein